MLLKPLRLLKIFCLIALLASACTIHADVSPTATPARPEIIEAVYTTAASGHLQVTLDELTLLRPDAQILAVLADGSGSPAYFLYPSNQPGVLQTTLAFSDFPLHAPGNDASLWVLAIQHQAYPVSETVGQSTIAAQLAQGFDALMQNETVVNNFLTEVVAAGDESLSAWFGEIEVLGEVFLPLLTLGTSQVQSPEGGFQLHYTVSADVVADSQAVSIQPAAIMNTPIAGYRQVLHEDFADAQSTLDWFIGRDGTYSASIVNRAYQIALTTLDPSRDNTALSWGSIQDLVFDDYIVRARMRVLQPDILARYGLWLHYLDDFNFVFFGVKNTGRYRVARFRYGYTELSPWASSPAVNLGSEDNILEVRLDGVEYTLAINGQPLVTTSDTAFHEGRIAFFCYSESVPATCHLEEIEVWIPEGDPFPQPTDTPIP